MKKIKQFAINIQMKTTDDLYTEYEKMIKNHKKYLYENIENIIQSNIRGIKRSDIELVIDDYFLTDIKMTGRETITKINEELEIAITEITDMPDNLDSSELLKKYTDKFTLVSRKNKIISIPDIIPQFTKELKKKLELHYIPFEGISDKSINQAIDLTTDKVTTFLKEYQKIFENDYDYIFDNFKNQNQKYITKILEKIPSIKEKNQELDTYRTILDLGNYNLIEENNILSAIDRESNERVELKFENNMLISTDGSIRCNVDNENERLGFYNGKTKTTILVHNGLISLIPPYNKKEEKQIISFKKTSKINGNKKDRYYQLYHNLKPVSDLQEIEKLLLQFKIHTKGIYEKFLTDPDFHKLLKQIESNKQEKNNTEEETKNQEKIQEIENKQVNSNNTEIINNQQPTVSVDKPSIEMTQNENNINTYNLIKK